jgi:hypothetical protein
MENKYEIEVVNFGDDYFIESEIAILTGLSLEEILIVTKGVQRHPGQWYVRAFQKLGYNCNNRFIKFDKKTQYPCMMRCKKRGVNNCWYGWIYYDGHIYDIHEGKITWAKWNALWPNFKVTSMLQVWI